MRKNKKMIGLLGAAGLMFTVASHATDVWINEIHYDNSGTDQAEGVEIAGPAGTSLSGWSVVLYNGATHTAYATLPLGGSLGNQCNGYGTQAVNAPGMQNGAPDGLALVNASGQVVQFLSYEGSFTASGGAAAGLASTNIGVAESEATPMGQSLQLGGSGNSYEQFLWMQPASASMGACNPGQSFTGDGGGNPPGGGPLEAYYDGVDTSSGAALKTSLHTIISDATKIPYSASTTDTWDVLEQADEDLDHPSDVLGLYDNVSYAKAGGGNNDYNREHTWPNSYGFPDNVGSNYAYTDMHMLMLASIGYNGARGNLPYGTCNASCTEYATTYNDGSGGGSGTYPGNSNWTNGTIWEVWKGKRGDVARAVLYMTVRFTGGTNPHTGYAEPNLVLTDNLAQIQITGGNTTGTAYMGLKSVLLQWAASDPVDDAERLRNEVVYQYQGNRNPFVDHPEWVDCVFNDVCTAP